MNDFRGFTIWPAKEAKCVAETLNRSLARGLDILELLSEEPAGLELHRIAKALDIPKSSAFNLIHTLLDKRYVTYDEATSRYALSLRMFEMGSAAVKDVTEQSVVHQYMQRVYAGCNETVHCGVPWRMPRTIPQGLGATWRPTIPRRTMSWSGSPRRVPPPMWSAACAWRGSTAC